MAALITNNAQGTLSAGITTSSTVLTLGSGQGAVFPNPTTPDWFAATLFNAGGVFESVKCTGRSGDTLTVLRAQEGTSAFAFSAGDKVDLRASGAVFNNKLDKDTGGTIAGALTVTGGVTANLTGNASTASAAAQWSTARTLTYTGDATGTISFDGSADASAALTLPNVNSNVGSFTNATLTVNAKGLVTAASSGSGVAAATTSTAGIVALATGAQVQAGTDTTHAATPASLAANQSSATTGYIVLPGGFVDMWGQTGALSGGVATTINLPGGFPTLSTLLNVTASGMSTTIGTATAGDAVDVVSASSFSITNGNGVARAYSWRAMGHL